MNTAAEPLVIAAHLAEPLVAGGPDEVGPLTVVPLFGPSASLEYRSYAEALALGAAVKELPKGASVNDLLVTNPTDTALLLYEGQELLGAQQDRTLDASVLIGAGDTKQVPVSCVEAGRWDGRRHAEHFRPSTQTAHPRLRRAKAEQARVARASGRDARADQQAVWSDVAESAVEHGATSDTGAMRDVFDARRDELAELRAGISRRDNQQGTLAVVNGEVIAMDWVGRSDVFAALHGLLVEGYCLDALSERQAEAGCSAERFVEAVCGAAANPAPAVGMGTDLDFQTPAAGGAALAVNGELVALSAFPANGNRSSAPAPRRAQIQRPSHRRRR